MEQDNSNSAPTQETAQPTVSNNSPQETQSTPVESTNTTESATPAVVSPQPEAAKSPEQTPQASKSEENLIVLTIKTPKEKENVNVKPDATIKEV